jgi:predicted small secreted protein
MAFHMEVQMKKTTLLLLGLLLILSGGCATVRGMAEDIQNLGKGLKKTVSDEDDRR